MVSVKKCISPFLDCSRLLICLFMYFSEINGEEKSSVAICDGSSKYIDWTTIRNANAAEGACAFLSTMSPQDRNSGYFLLASFACICETN